MVMSCGQKYLFSIFVYKKLKTAKYCNTMKYKINQV